MESLLGIKDWQFPGHVAPEYSPAKVLKSQQWVFPVTNTQAPRVELPIEIELGVARGELDSVLSGRVLPQVLEDLGLSQSVGDKFVSQISELAAADGLKLTEEEGRLLANLLFLVGKKFSDEI